MNVSIGERWEEFLTTILESGRYGSASEVVREGLRLVEEREMRLAALCQTIAAAIAQGGSHDDADIDAALETQTERLKVQGY